MYIPIQFFGLFFIITLYSHLGTCFNHSIPVRRRLKRYKHWFQDESLPTEPFRRALVVAMFRNPFDWIEAMRKKVNDSSELTESIMT